jgi:hypothetical protein
MSTPRARACGVPARAGAGRAPPRRSASGPICPVRDLAEGGADDDDDGEVDDVAARG